MIFNINDYVRIRLTDKGREVLKRNHFEFWSKFSSPSPYIPPLEDENGCSKWQLWILMQELGGHMTIGMENLFDTNIEIVEKDYSTALPKELFEI